MIEDLAKITTIPVQTLQRLLMNAVYCICHSVLENFNNKEAASQVDIGFGKLSVLVEDNKIQYKFIPSQKFNQTMIETINSNTSPLIKYAEDILNSKLINTYKELM